MSVEDIKRIEKKVDLLYRILLSLNIPEVEGPYDQSYMSDFMTELIPLFNLTGDSGIERSIIKEIISLEELDEWDRETKEKLAKLEKTYKAKEYMAKDEGEIISKIRSLSKLLSGLTEIRDARNKFIYKLEKELKDDKGDERMIKLFFELQSKVGLKYFHKGKIHLYVRRINDMVEKLKNEKFL